MATNQTTNYQLNQWEPADQVLRTDFNADNAKLDTALLALDASKLGHFQIIRSAALEENYYRINLDLTGINWSEWALAGFTFGRNNPLNNLVDSLYLFCELSTESGTHRYIQIHPYNVLVVFFPRHNEDNLVSGVYVSEESGVAFGDYSFQELTKLSVCYSTSMYTFASGADLTLWGIK